MIVSSWLSRTTANSDTEALKITELQIIKIFSNKKHIFKFCDGHPSMQIAINYENAMFNAWRQYCVVDMQHR